MKMLLIGVTTKCTMRCILLNSKDFYKEELQHDVDGIPPYHFNFTSDGKLADFYFTITYVNLSTFGVSEFLSPSPRCIMLAGVRALDKRAACNSS